MRRSEALENRPLQRLRKVEEGPHKHVTVDTRWDVEHDLTRVCRVDDFAESEAENIPAAKISGKGNEVPAVLLAHEGNSAIAI